MSACCDGTPKRSLKRGRKSSSTRLASSMVVARASLSSETSLSWRVPTDASSFQIVNASGQLQTKTGVTYDYETKSSYSVTVSVSDGNGGSDSIDVTINVTNVNENPKLELESAFSDRTMTVGTPTTIALLGKFSDPDGDALFYSGSSSDTRVVAASVTGATLTLTALTTGSATITYAVADRVTDDLDRLTAKGTFEVTVELPPIAKVTDLRGEPGTVGGTIKLDWEPADGAISYEVQLGRRPVPFIGVYLWVTLSDSEVTINVAETSAVVKGLEGGETYRHRVVGVRGVGANRIYGPESDPVDTTLPLPDKVQQPTGSAGDNHREIKLKWNAADGATGYKVRQKKPGRFSFLDSWIELPGEGFGITFRDTTIAVISNLDPDKTYVYQVLATGVHGDGEWSKESDEIAVRDERPAKPQGLEALLYQGARGIYLKWDASAGAQGYEVQVSPTGSSQQQVPTSSSEAVVVLGLTPFTNYTFTVRAWKMYDGSRLHSAPSEIEREAPEPTLWWGHQADHNVKYAIGTIDNSFIQDAIWPAVDDWNDRLPEVMGKGLAICPAPGLACNDNFTVTIKTVDNKNQSIYKPNTKPEEGCGHVRACVKPQGSGGSSAGPGKHMENMVMVFEDPPWLAMNGDGRPYTHTEYVWTDVRSKDNDPVPCTEDPSTCAMKPVRKYLYVGRVMRHEFGHTLGLPDFYNGKTGLSGLKAVMGLTSDDIEYQDIEQLKAIYLLHSQH